MKKKQPARNRARNASAKELERDAKQQLAYLDQYKPRPRKMTVEEYEDGQKQIAYLDNRDALALHFWRELVAHLRRGNLTAAHYLLTSPAYLGNFVPGHGARPPASIKEDLAKLGITSRAQLDRWAQAGAPEHRGKVLLQVLETLAGACLFDEMLALLPFAREALRQGQPDAPNCRQAVSVCRQAMLHLSPDHGANAYDADLITMRRNAAGLRKPKARR